MSAFKLALAPPETLGRRFQYALLSLDPELADVDPLAGYAAFRSVDDFVELIEEAIDAIKALEVSAGRRGREGKCPPSRVAGIDCCRLHRGPQLYTAGVSDRKLIEEAGFTKCVYHTARGQAGTAWAHAAVSYAAMVLERGGPLGGAARDLPWLAKATLFGKVRTVGGGARGRAARPTLDTLGTVLLGGVVAFQGSQRLGRGAEAAPIEFYLIPDSVHEGYYVLRSLMMRDGVESSTAMKAARLANEYPVSLEIAVALALASDLSLRLGPASDVAKLRRASELEKTAALLTVTPQQRPMVRGAVPLSLAVYASYSRASLASFFHAASQARGRAVSEVQGLRDLLGRCATAMYLQAASGGGDHLPSCIRDLYSAAYQARRAGYPSLAGALEELAERLASDYLKIVWRWEPT